MAASQTSASLIALMAVVVAILSLIGGSLAAEAPAPSPASAAGAISPSFGFTCLVAFVAFLFRSALKI
ncbi:hypothetical protein Acr_25g0010940 [Actinidia rufa]|uniref:Uncharacterized protein n=1 Tax=Actinidia rufa TaxID=165716 RepID=A0A7J0H0Y3_9ERIC|nr:hypothetical protein Acr_25g0010940 [Actinidia rufa]